MEANKMEDNEDIPETFVVRCALCGGSDIGNPIHRLELCNKPNNDD